MTPHKVLEAALAYTRKGLFVIPLCWPTRAGECGCGNPLHKDEPRNIGKAPLLGKGWQKMRADEAQVRRWWGRWPKANLGILIEPSGLLIVDPDSDAAVEECRGRELLGTAIVRTANGLHAYFKRPDGAPTTRKTNRGDCKDIDVFTTGFVVAPPSKHATGTLYSWEGGEMQLAPQWALDQLAPQTEAPFPKQAPRAHGSWGPTDPARLESALGHIDPGCDLTAWIKVLCGIKSAFPGEDGFQMFLRWSQSGANFKGEADCRKHWRSKRAEGTVNVDTVFWMAKEAGWSPPSRVRSSRPRAGGGGAVPPGGGSGSGGAPPGGGGAKPPPRGQGEPEPPLEVSSGKFQYTFGETVWQHTITDDGGLENPRLLARRVWPRAVVQDVDTGSRGLLYRYADQDQGGHMRQGVMPGEAWIDKSPARRASEEAARGGVAIEPYQGVPFVIAMGRWASDTGAPWRKAVSTSGWRRCGHQLVFTAAPETFGAPWVWSGDDVSRDRRGTLGGWLAEVEWAASGSRAMTLALAVAFGGSLVEPLGQGSFMVHFFGGSSTGKTIAALMGASVWGDPKRPASWKDTGGYLLEMLPLHSGRCLTIDDLRKAGHPRAVASLVLALSDNTTKGRLYRTGQRQRVNRFALSALSNGEQSMGAYLGELDDVGHGVRCIDLPIELGDSTHDHEHAKRCEQWLGEGAFGVAGPAWAEFLVGLLAEAGGVERIKAGVARYVGVASTLTGGHATNDRIAFSLALCAAALELAQEAGVAPQTGVSPDEMLAWAVASVVTERGREVCPEERCLVELLGRVVRNPQAYPTANQFQDAPPRELGGIYEPGLNKLYVTEAHIRPLCSDMRVSPRTWLRWLAAQKYSAPPQRSTRLGNCPALVQRWHTLDLSRCRGVT